MPYRRAPTCEKRVYLHRYAAQADVILFSEKIFAKTDAKSVARTRIICYNHQVIAAEESEAANTATGRLSMLLKIR